MTFPLRRGNSFPKIKKNSKIQYAFPGKRTDKRKSRVIYLDGLCILLLLLLLFISIGYPDMVSKWLELTTVVILWEVCPRAGAQKKESSGTECSIVSNT